MAALTTLDTAVVDGALPATHWTLLHLFLRDAGDSDTAIHAVCTMIHKELTRDPTNYPLTDALKIIAGSAVGVHMFKYLLDMEGMVEALSQDGGSAVFSALCTLIREPRTDAMCVCLAKFLSDGYAAHSRRVLVDSCTNLIHWGTVVNHAVRYKKTATALHLAEHGARLDVTDDQGETAWGLACRLDLESCITAWLPHVDQWKDAAFAFPTSSNDVSLCWLLKHGRVDAACALLPHVPPPLFAHVFTGGFTLLIHACRAGCAEAAAAALSVPMCNVAARSIGHWDTALHWAISKRMWSTVDVLLADERAAPTALGISTAGWTILALAIANNAPMRCIDAILARKGVGTWFINTAIDGTGNTALHLAARRGREDVVNAILEAVPTMHHRKNKNGEFPSVVASRDMAPHVVARLADAAERSPCA